MIGQLKPRYLYNLSMYNKTLEQRNSFLKNKVENDEMLEIWDEKLYEYGKIINNYRNDFIKKISQKIQGIHDTITKEIIEIEKKENLKETVKFNMQKIFYKFEEIVKENPGQYMWQHKRWRS